MESWRDLKKGFADLPRIYGSMGLLERNSESPPDICRGTLMK